MANTLDSIVPEALELSPHDRFLLASQLLRSVEPEETKNWDAEIEARIASFDRGELEASPVSDTVSRIRERHLK